jgi:hypothetical protein
VPAPDDYRSHRLVPRDDLIVQRLLDETVVLDPAAGTYVRLNPAGRFIWERLDGGRSIEELARALAGEFGIDASRAHEDVSAFARDLAARGLAELSV